MQAHSEAVSKTQSMYVKFDVSKCESHVSTSGRRHDHVVIRLAIKIRKQSE